MKSNKLKARMVEKGYSQRSLADELGMNKNTLNNKLNGKYEFLFSEAVKVCRLLEITDPATALEIFLE